MKTVKGFDFSNPFFALKMALSHFSGYLFCNNTLNFVVLQRFEKDYYASVLPGSVFCYFSF